MKFFERFISNHVLANILFVLVIIMGSISFMDLPRARDPDVNFNWVNILTVLPGASSLEIEKRVTDPLEDAIARNLKHIFFVSSTSREGVSSITVRFDQVDQDAFDKLVADLRREVQNAYNDKLPDEAIEPYLWVITTASGFPAATVVLKPDRFDDDFRRYSEVMRKEMERINGVEKVEAQGVEDPELHIAFDPEKLIGLGVSPTDIADTVRTYFRDSAIGDISTSKNNWTIRLEGTSSSLDDLKQIPLVSTSGIVALGSVAEIYRSQEEAKILVSYEQEPAIMFSIYRESGANTLQMLDRIRAFITAENLTNSRQGYELVLADDQTVSTREAIGLMQNNALIGLVLVIFVSWLFLGSRISLITSIGIPFTLAGTFIIIHYSGFSTLNNSVLLGVVISLGMLVDDAVVVVESIYYRLERGSRAMTAALEALREVAAPVLTSVLTTISVFLPLMLMEGVVGEFMKVIPVVVCLALAVSLIEAFWMLPAHVNFLNINYSAKARSQIIRTQLTRRVRHQYSRLLLKVLRYPGRSLAAVGGVALIALVLLFSGVLKFKFFASDPYRVFYISTEMPAGTLLKETLAVTEEIEQKTLKLLNGSEVRSSIAFAGVKFTKTEPLYGDHLGQIMISLQPHKSGQAGVREIVAAVKSRLGESYRQAKVTTLLVEEGPPTGQPINLKVRGDELENIKHAVDEITGFMRENGLYSNINLDFNTGKPQALVKLDGDAIKRANLNPEMITRTLQAYVDGEVVTRFQDKGEEVDVRIKANIPDTIDHIDALFEQVIYTPDGQAINLGSLLKIEYDYGLESIRHYNYLRTITILADIDESRTNTVEANALIAEFWQQRASSYPRIDLDFSGELEDIEESINSISMLFLIGIGLIYMILGTQFRSYWQPLLILTSVPLAFIGVVFGLTLTNNPLSVFTLYGVVALSGIAVNSAIVLISAANSRLNAGMSVLHATVYAARRRVIPILITSLTTIAGLFSLAAGVAGKSLVWGPVATAIVSGLFFSTGLTLFVIPLLYRSLQDSRLITRLRNQQLVDEQP